MGLAQRADRIISGEELVVKAIQDQKAKLVFLAHDAGPNLTKKIQDKSDYYQVEVITVFSTLELSIAVGKSRKVLGLGSTYVKGQSHNRGNHKGNHKDCPYYNSTFLQYLHFSFLWVLLPFSSGF